MKPYRSFTESELKWINKFEKLLKSKECKNLFIFIGSGTPCVYPGRYMNDIGSVDREAPNKSFIAECDIDGGDW